MPLVQISMWPGMSDEKARELISGITDVFVKMGIPQQAVEVLIHEVPKTHWGQGGVPASEKFKDVEPPK